MPGSARVGAAPTGPATSFPRSSSPLACHRGGGARASSNTWRPCGRAGGPDPVEFHGERYGIPRSQVGPKPQRDTIPVFLGALVRPTVERAARLADGVVLVAVDWEATRAQVGWYRAAGSTGTVVVNTLMPDLGPAAPEEAFVAAVLADLERAAAAGADDYLSTSSAPSVNIQYFGFGSTSPTCIGIAYALLPGSLNVYLSTPQAVAGEMYRFADELAPGHHRAGRPARLASRLTLHNIGRPLRLPTVETTEPTELTVRTRDGVELCVQTFGDPADPSVVLIQGASSSMDWWEDEFCRRLVAAGRHVVRYDNRDTGASTAYPPGEPGYTGADLTDDLLAVLDATGIEHAHLVGLSMGGGIAQDVALDHPERVLSLTLISTQPVGPRPEGLDLPSMTDDMAAFFAGGLPDPDWSDRDAVIAWVVDGFRPFAGSGPFDEAGLRAVAARVVDRSRSLASGGNHLAVDQGPEQTRSLTDLDVPTLVIHGAEDPLFPLPHGEAIARLIPGATLLVLDRTGHELPRRVWGTVVPAIVAHTA